MEYAIDVEAAFVSRWDGEQRAGPGSRDAGGAHVANARKRRRRSGGRVAHTALAGDAPRHVARSSVGGDGALPIQGHAANRRPGHGPQRAAYEEQHRAEQPNGRSEDQRARERAPRRAREPRECEL